MQHTTKATWHVARGMGALRGLRKVRRAGAVRPHCCHDSEAKGVRQRSEEHLGVVEEVEVVPGEPSADTMAKRQLGFAHSASPRLVCDLAGATSLSAALELNWNSRHSHCPTTPTQPQRLLTPMLTPPRYSIAFFFEPNFDTLVEALPCCCGPHRPPRYPPTTAGQHLLDKYAQTHAGYQAPGETQAAGETQVAA